MSKKSFKLNVGFITGVFAVCAVSIATGYFLKSGSISADTAATTDLEYSNSESFKVSTASLLNLTKNLNNAQTCKKSTGSASATLTDLTDAEKEQYGENAKAYVVKINGKMSEWRLVMAASLVNDANDYTPNDGKQTDVMVEYTLTYINDPRSNKDSWGSGVGNITISYGSSFFKKTYGTIVKNDPWQDYIKIKNGYTNFTKLGSDSFNLSILFAGKNNDGCITNLDLKDSLKASVTAGASVTATASTTTTSSTTASATVTETTTVAAESSTTVTATPTSTTAVSCDSKDSTGNCATETTDKEVANFRGCYYSGKNFDQYVGSRNDKIDFSWGSGPATSKTGNNNFSIRWGGYFNTKYADEYTFSALTDDGVRVWVNDQLVIDAWTTGQKTSTGKIDLPVGKFPIMVEYFESTGNAKAQLTWKSKSTVKTPNATATVTHASNYICEGQSTVSPTPTVTASASTTPTVGYDYYGDDVLNMTLKVDPIQGKLPLTVNASASVGGTATGKIHWRIYCGDKDANVSSGVVPPDLNVTDYETSKALSCTYDTKNSYRVWAIAERDGKKVFTKVWVKAGTVTPAQQTVSYDLKKGFNIFGSDLYTTSNRFTDVSGDLTIFRYNYFQYPKWLRWPQKDVKFGLFPGNAYYIYSPTDRTVSIKMDEKGLDLNDRRLFQGWNMIRVNDEHKGLEGVKAQLAINRAKDPMNVGTSNYNRCIIKNQSLKELVDEGVAYKYVYVIKDGNATDACDAFKLLETGTVAESCAKINAAKSATTSTSSCTACSLDVVDELESGDILWVYLFESKMRQIKGATNANTPTTTNSSTTKSISLSGDLCK